MLLLSAGLLLGLPGVVSHGVLHACGVVLAVAVVRLSGNQKFRVSD